MRHATNYSLGILGDPDSTDLWQQIISHIPDEILLKPHVRILIVACGHGTEADILVHRMKSLGKTNQEIRDSIYLIDKYQTFTNAIKKKGYTNVITRDFLEWETDMKFDVVIGNPPYTKGAKILYGYFFEKSLNLSKELVISVMPVNLESNHDKLKYHNIRVKKHITYLSENVSSYFNVGYSNIYYIIANVNKHNDISTYKDPLDDLELLHPERKRLLFIKGDTETGQCKTDPSGIIAIDKIHKNDKVSYKKIPQKVYEKSKKKSNAKYLICVNHTPSYGKFNCAIIENTHNFTWAIWTFVTEAETLTEAKKLKTWLQSEEIQKEVRKMFDKKAKGFYTISKKMLDRLPYYE